MSLSFPSISIAPDGSRNMEQSRMRTSSSSMFFNSFNKNNIAFLAFGNRQSSVEADLSTISSKTVSSLKIKMDSSTISMQEYAGKSPNKQKGKESSGMEEPRQLMLVAAFEVINHKLYYYCY